MDAQRNYYPADRNYKTAMLRVQSSQLCVTSELQIIKYLPHTPSRSAEPWAQLLCQNTFEEYWALGTANTFSVKFEEDQQATMMWTKNRRGDDFCDHLQLLLKMMEHSIGSAGAVFKMFCPAKIVLEDDTNVLLLGGNLQRLVV